jgi:hypothetical protein
MFKKYVTKKRNWQLFKIFSLKNILSDSSSKNQINTDSQVSLSNNEI